MVGNEGCCKKETEYYLDVVYEVRVENTMILAVAFRVPPISFRDCLSLCLLASAQSVEGSRTGDFFRYRIGTREFLIPSLCIIQYSSTYFDCVAPNSSCHFAFMSTVLHLRNYPSLRNIHLYMFLVQKLHFNDLLGSFMSDYHHAYPDAGYFTFSIS